jgi:hypothetical protein
MTNMQAILQKTFIQNFTDAQPSEEVTGVFESFFYMENPKGERKIQIQKIEQTRTPGKSIGGIRCLGGVSILY